MSVITSTAAPSGELATGVPVAVVVPLAVAAVLLSTVATMELETIVLCPGAKLPTEPTTVPSSLTTTSSIAVSPVLTTT